MSTIIKEENLQYVSGTLFGWGERGTLRLTEENLVWIGDKSKFEFKLTNISNVGVGKWGANNVLQIAYKNNIYKFLNKDWTVVFFGVESDRKYINIADWINKIDDARLNKNKKPDNDEIPLNTLKNRLAKGEISIAEYEILKKLIE